MELKFSRKIRSAEASNEMRGTCRRAKILMPALAGKSNHWSAFTSRDEQHVGASCFGRPFLAELAFGRHGFHHNFIKYRLLQHLATRYPNPPAINISCRASGSSKSRLTSHSPPRPQYIQPIRQSRCLSLRAGRLHYLRTWRSASVRWIRR